MAELPFWPANGVKDGLTRFQENMELIYTTSVQVYERVILTGGNPFQY
jgi:hypothetical protein